MTTITATELKQNLGYYLEKTEEEDIIVTKNNKLAYKITKLGKKPKSISDLFGTLPPLPEDFDYKKERAERLLKKYGYKK